MEGCTSLQSSAFGMAGFRVWTGIAANLVAETVSGIPPFIAQAGVVVCHKSHGEKVAVHVRDRGDFRKD